MGGVLRVRIGIGEHLGNRKAVSEPKGGDWAKKETVAVTKERKQRKLRKKKIQKCARNHRPKEGHVRNLAGKKGQKVLKRREWKIALPPSGESGGANDILMAAKVIKRTARGGSRKNNTTGGGEVIGTVCERGGRRSQASKIREARKETHPPPLGNVIGGDDYEPFTI